MRVFAIVMMALLALVGCSNSDPRAENDRVVIEILSGWWAGLTPNQMLTECDAYRDQDALQHLTMSVAIDKATDYKYFMYSETYDLFFTKVCEDLP